MIKWSGKEYTFVGTEEEDVASLKRRLQADTQVLPKRQKILGLKTRAGKPAADDDLLSNLLLKAGQKFMMMGQAPNLAVFFLAIKQSVAHEVDQQSI